MSQVVQLKPSLTTPFKRRVILYITLPLVFFLLGFVPMWLVARESSSALSVVGHQMSLARIQNNLASAAIDAQRGDYELALQETSSFFTSLRAEADNRDASALSPAEIDGVQALFAGQDDLITLIARRDPASAKRLSDLYVSYRQIVK
jgi:hypothetical protein